MLVTDIRPVWFIYYVTKCATCVFHEKDIRSENAWFLASYNEAKTLVLHAFILLMENARGTIGHVWFIYYHAIGSVKNVTQNRQEMLLINLIPTF